MVRNRDPSLRDGDLIVGGPDFSHFVVASRGDEGVRPLAGAVESLEAAARHFDFLLARWLACGLPVFRPTPALAAGLLLTDPGEVAEAEPWPFPAFFLTLPPGLEVPLDGGDRVTGAAFHDLVADVPGVGRLRMLAVFTVRGADGGDGDVHLSEPGGLLDLGDPPEDLGEARARSVSVCARLLLGVARWVAERGRGRRVQTGAGLRARASGRARAQTPEVWELGREVRLPAEVLDLAAAAVSGSGPRATWRVRARFCVRGHWRNQACGRGRAERRRIWVAPFWKGPADGARLAHLYRDA